MKVVTTIDEVRAVRRRQGTATLGFVPTMGYLHEGHLDLVRRARAENDYVAVSIYVNPKQFGPTEDLSRYPRDLERDLSLLRAEGVALVFAPSDAEMYPPGYQTRVLVTGVTQPLEGAKRPTHFEGVTTVVAKLFNIVRPNRAYFGQKDAQQTVVVRQMARDLNLDLDIVVCPTTREPDGLAMSSRNKYLTAEQRPAATVLYRALRAAEALWRGGTRDGAVLRDAMRRVLDAEPLARVDYVSAADPLTLEEWEGDARAGAGALLSLAVFMGPTRLIDNVLLNDRPADE
ncbi:pantoate--beta-alanine ligase [Promineifilum sp.]|uniref:pantoate--beta-alanine ligase n=1 Tax=Promineifilum sp. TaxID=2664178 RepID=UPI0035B2EDCB